MNRVFRKVTGEPVPDIVKHTIDIVKECPWIEIHIGTDSQNHRRSTVYVTAIAYRYGNRGVHYIYHKHKPGRSLSIRLSQNPGQFFHQDIFQIIVLLFPCRVPRRERG